MNHRPFEDWLANDQPLTSEEKRAMQTHLQECTHCAALAEVDLALHSTRMAAPAPGFALRFQKRLEAQRVLERRNRLVGALILSVSGVGLVAWYAAPFLIRFIGSPAEWLSAAVSFLLTLLSMAEAVGDLGSILFRVLPGFVPPFAWLILVSAFGGAALLWTVSIWRFTRFTRGA